MTQFPLICESLRAANTSCARCSRGLCVVPIGFEFLHCKAKTFLVASDHVLTYHNGGHCGNCWALAFGFDSPNE